MKLGILTLVVAAAILVSFISFVVFSDLENKQSEIKKFIQLEEN